MPRSFSISGRKIGPDYPPYIVAELSANHNGRLEKALEIVEASAKAGVDAIKIQTFEADSITLDSDRPEFQITQGPRAGQSLYELYQVARTARSWHEPIFKCAAENGVAGFSSPFDLDAVDFLDSLGVPAFKIASFELVDIPLIRKAAKTGKPIIISTGMARPGDVSDAIAACHTENNDQIILLYCVSGYPTPVEELNLANLANLARSTGCLVGLSDHTLTTSTAVAAVALGACFIEKHITMNREDGGLDAAFSLEPQEFKTLVKTSNEVWRSIGKVTHELKPSEQYTSRLRRSLYSNQDIKSGEALGPHNVVSVRPNNGLAPKHYYDVVKRRAVVDISRATPLSWDMLD